MPESTALGRWELIVRKDGRLTDIYQQAFGDKKVPVVPCDEAAIERAWYELGLQMVEEGFIPPAFISDALREKLKRCVVHVLLAAGDDPLNAEAPAE